jgi:hypothetical protein
MGRFGWRLADVAARPVSRSTPKPLLKWYL